MIQLTDGYVQYKTKQTVSRIYWSTTKISDTGSANHLITQLCTKTLNMTFLLLVTWAVKVCGILKSMAQRRWLSYPLQGSLGISLHLLLCRHSLASCCFAYWASHIHNKNSEKALGVSCSLTQVPSANNWSEPRLWIDFVQGDRLRFRYL